MHFSIITSIISFTTLLASSEQSCLHKGCKELNSGLKLADLNKVIGKFDMLRENQIRVVQWNILHDLKDIGLDNWDLRKQDLCNYIHKLQPTVMGLQEVMKHQLDYLKTCLPDYAAVGEPRENKKDAQYNPIFYKKSNRIKFLETGTFWLSKTPDVIGTSLPHIVEPRICTWVKLQYAIKKQSGYQWKTTYVATTHLAWRKESFAKSQVEVLTNHLRNTIMKGEDYPVIFMGDLNWEDDSAMYKEVTNQKWLSNTMAHALHPFPNITALPPYPGLVDYIWESGYFTLISSTMIDSRPNGRYLSDHRPVFSVLTLP